MRPGELYWVEYPQADGREQAGRRPSLILQDDGYAGRSPLVLTIPLTTAATTLARFPAVVPITPSSSNGLTAHSYILVFQLRATDRRRVRESIGIIEPAVLALVYDALDRMTGRIRPFPPPPPSPPQPYQRNIDV